MKTDFDYLTMVIGFIGMLIIQFLGNMIRKKICPPNDLEVPESLLQSLRDMPADFLASHLRVFGNVGKCTVRFEVENESWYLRHLPGVRNKVIRHHDFKLDHVSIFYAAFQVATAARCDKMVGFSSRTIPDAVIHLLAKEGPQEVNKTNYYTILALYAARYPFTITEPTDSVAASLTMGVGNFVLNTLRRQPGAPVESTVGPIVPLRDDAEIKVKQTTIREKMTRARYRAPPVEDGLGVRDNSKANVFSAASRQIQAKSSIPRDAATVESVGKWYGKIIDLLICTMSTTAKKKVAPPRSWPQRAYEVALSGVHNTKRVTFSFFVKVQEVMRLSKPSRCIANCPIVKTLQMACVFGPIEEAIMICFKQYTKKEMTDEEWVYKAQEKLFHFPHALSTDFSCYDSTIGFCYTKLEAELVSRVREVMDLGVSGEITENFKRQPRLKITNPYMDISMPACRLSGDRFTSMGNFLINFALVLSHLDLQGQSDEAEALLKGQSSTYDLLLEGDDRVVFSKEPEDASTWVQHAAAAGFILEPAVLMGGYMEFCGKWITRDFYCCIPSKALSKVPYQSDVPSEMSLDSDEFFLLVVGSLMSTYLTGVYNTPVVNHIYIAVIEYWCNQRPELMIPFHETSVKMEDLPSQLLACIPEDKMKQRNDVRQYVNYPVLTSRGVLKDHHFEIGNGREFYEQFIGTEVVTPEQPLYLSCAKNIKDLVRVSEGVLPNARSKIKAKDVPKPEGGNPHKTVGKEGGPTVHVRGKRGAGKSAGRGLDKPKVPSDEVDLKQTERQANVPTQGKMGAQANPRIGTKPVVSTTVVRKLSRKEKKKQPLGSGFVMATDPVDTAQVDLVGQGKSMLG